MFTYAVQISWHALWIVGAKLTERISHIFNFSSETFASVGTDVRSMHLYEPLKSADSFVPTVYMYSERKGVGPMVSCITFPHGIDACVAGRLAHVFKRRPPPPIMQQKIVSLINSYMNSCPFEDIQETRNARTF